MTAPTSGDEPTDLRRDRILRSLHPSAVQRHAQRWRGIRAVLSLITTAGLYVWLLSAHQAALQATSDADPSPEHMIEVALLLGLSICASVVLVGVAVFSAISHRVRRSR